ncbi:MAG: ABC transporter substrate-binding protein [Chloroflexi bacterium]|nr:ABC transporter substrate-binding protein [Chloroflexota bacterium]
MVFHRVLLPVLVIATSSWFLACGAQATPTPTRAPTAAPPPAAPKATAVPSPAATKATVPAASTPSAKQATTPSAKPVAERPLDPPVVLKSGGVPTSITESGVFAAMERGYFKELGIDIELNIFDNAPKQVPALATNQIQVGTGAMNAGIYNSIARGLGIRIVAPQSRYDPGFSAMHLLVRKDLADNGVIKDWKDLKGKNVALASTASASEFIIYKALEKGGLKLTDINEVVMPFPDMMAAFANKGIDVALPNEPTATIIVNNGVAVLWHQASDAAPMLQNSVIVFSPQMTQNPELANRWMIGYLKGVRDYNDAIKKNKNRDAFIAILQKYTTVKDKALYDKMSWASVDPNGKINIDSMREQLAWYTSIGKIEGKVDLDAAIDTRFTEYAVSRLGVYQE